MAEPKNLGPTLEALNWTLFAFALVTTLLRIFTRLWNRRWGRDDSAVAVAMVISMAGDVAIHMSVEVGLGRHFDDLSSHQQEDVLRTLLIDYAIFLWSWSVPKLAVASLLGRIFTPKRHAVWIIYSLAIISILFSVAMSAMWLTQCVPIQRIWKPDVPGHCSENYTQATYIVFVTAAIYSAVVDVGVSVYAVWGITQLAMSRKLKVIAGVPLSLGIVAAVATAYKVCTYNVLKDPMSRSDPTFNGVPMIICTSIEGNALILAANLPPLNSFPEVVRGVKEAWTRRFNNGSHSGHTSTGGGPSNSYRLNTYSAGTNSSGTSPSTRAQRTPSELEAARQDAAEKEVWVNYVVQGAARPGATSMRFADYAAANGFPAASITNTNASTECTCEGAAKPPRAGLLPTTAIFRATRVDVAEEQWLRSTPRTTAANGRDAIHTIPAATQRGRLALRTN